MQERQLHRPQDPQPDPHLLDEVTPGAQTNGQRPSLVHKSPHAYPLRHTGHTNVASRPVKSDSLIPRRI